MTGRLICPDPACGNREEFVSGRTLILGTVLDGRGRVFDQEERGRSDAGFDVACARCGTVVVPSPVSGRAGARAADAPPYERWLTAVIEVLFAGGLSAEAIGTDEAEELVIAVLCRGGCEAGLGKARTRRLLEALYAPLTEHAVYADAEGSLGTVLVVDLRRAGAGYPGRLAHRVLVDLESLPGYARDRSGLAELYEKARSFADVGDASGASKGAAGAPGGRA